MKIYLITALLCGLFVNSAYCVNEKSFNLLSEDKIPEANLAIIEELLNNIHVRLDKIEKRLDGVSPEYAAPKAVVTEPVQTESTVVECHPAPVMQYAQQVQAAPTYSSVSYTYPQSSSVSYPQSNNSVSYYSYPQQPRAPAQQYYQYRSVAPATRFFRGGGRT